MKRSNELKSVIWAMNRSAMGIVLRRSEDDESHEPTPVVPRLIEPTDGPTEGVLAGLDVQRSKKTVAVVPLRGVIGLHDFWADVDVAQFAAVVGSLVANDSIGAIVLDVDSPGGSVYGLNEAADVLYAARKEKPIYAVSTGMMASAAYFLGTAASKTFVSPSAEVGSIGTWTMHADMSKALEEMGVAVTLISAGKFKVEGNPFSALSDEAREAIQAEVNEYYGMFVAAVAKHRGRRESTVRSGFGEGRLLTAQRALDEGMVDGIATLSDVLGAVVPSKRQRGRQANALGALAIEGAHGGPGA